VGHDDSRIPFGSTLPPKYIIINFKIYITT
jgi:hypothetical protein